MLTRDQVTLILTQMAIENCSFMMYLYTLREYGYAPAEKIQAYFETVQHIEQHVADQRSIDYWPDVFDLGWCPN